MNILLINTSMSNQPNSLQQALQANEKNIADLIHQEINLLLLAQLFREQPQLAQQKDFIFHKIYLSTTRSLESLLFSFLERQGEQINEARLQQMKGDIQLFVQELINEKQEELEATARWLDRL
ncbi:MAG: hypothetical protein AAFU64_04895 [Bacteroidota bacterium]